MKKNIKYFIMPIFFMLCLQYCISDVKVGIPYYSPSIEISKNKKTFISRYKPLQSYYQENKEDYKIVEVWSENASRIKNNNRELEILPNVYLMIRLDKNVMVDMNTAYENDKGEKIGMGYTNEKMFYEMNQEEQKQDTIKLYFINNNYSQLLQFVKIK